MVFRNRTEAGQLLGEALLPFVAGETLVLALPRGGVPVGVAVARLLHAALDTLVVRKLGLPGYEECAFGAIGPDETLYLDRVTVTSLGITKEEVATIREREAEELARREAVLQSGQWSQGCVPATVIIVDDGLATGATARVAIRVSKVRYSTARIILAVPVGAPAALAELRREADTVVCLSAPASFASVGQWYASFPPISLSEAKELLEAANAVH